MKKLLSILLLACVWVSQSSFTLAEEGLTKEDRKTIIKYLKESEDALYDRIRKLSAEQWTYKPNAESWSPAEICEHIIKAEPVVIKRVNNIVEGDYQPELISESLAKTQEMITFIVGRSEKFQAPKHILPEGAYGSPDEFIDAFSAVRKETIQFVKTLDKPVKAYYEEFGPIGTVNGYHWLMFISAHTIRHTNQLVEVLDHPEFPI